MDNLVQDNPIRRSLLALEAAAWLTLAALALRTLSFARIVTLVAARPRRARPHLSSATARAVGWAVDAATCRAPWRPVCFERALAASTMLRMRGFAPVLYYGAKSGGARGVAAHVWVRLDGVDVVGCDEASGFALLARFPTVGADDGLPAL